MSLPVLLVSQLWLQSSLSSFLFVGMPGGIELLVVLFVLFVLFGVPATLLVLLGYKHLRHSAETETGTDERLAELESEIEQLKARLEGEEE